MTNLKLFATSVVCAIGLALTACGGGLSVAVPGAAQSPSITSQPVNQSVIAGQSATFSVAATGSATLSFQWKKYGSNIPGATASSYTTPATSPADSGAVFTVVVSNSAGSATSTHATLTVTAAAEAPTVTTPPANLPALPGAPAITTQPAAQTVVTGTTASFSVSATGTSLSYQWKKNGTNIPGATSSSYITPATSMADTNATYSVSVSNTEGQVTSSNAALTVTAVVVAPTITRQPAAQTITAGQTATFTVTATGTGTLSYQWRKNGVNITGGSGATTNSYTTPDMGYAGNGAVYSVVVTDSAGSATSSTATLTVSKSSTAKSYGYVANASDGLYDKTECVQDNNTGLIWEGKTASPATSRLGTSTYTNYDSTTSHQKWNGVWSNPNQTEIDASTNSIGYKNSVNTSALCGYMDWRMPTREELEGILASSGSQKIDTAWFPNTQAHYYWTSSPYVGVSSVAWYVNFYYGVVYFGYDFRYYYGFHVRLVR